MEIACPRSDAHQTALRLVWRIMFSSPHSLASSLDRTPPDFPKSITGGATTASLRGPGIMKTTFRTQALAFLPAFLAVLSLGAFGPLRANAQESASSASPAESVQATSSPSTSTSTSTSSAQKADTDWDGISVELTSVTKGEGDTLTIKFKYTNTGS